MVQNTFFVLDNDPDRHEVGGRGMLSLLCLG